MVKFSDLEKGNSNPQKSPEKDSRDSSRSSGVSFRALERGTRRVASAESALPKEISEAERRAVYDTATDYLTGVLDAVRKRRRFELAPGEDIIRRIINFKAALDPLLIRAIYEDNPRKYIVNHCVNVTIFSIKMATVLGLSNLEQEQIGLAALLHEVGMGVIPEKLIYKEQGLEPKEYEIFKKRPEFGYQILKGFGEDYGFLADTALQVHECMDGSGYPVGLSGDKIHLYAQIIGLVDLYEALSHSRPQRDKYPHFSAVKQIIKIGKRRYPKKFLKALLNIFSIFPLHSLVKLNSNAIGKVVQTYPQQPMRPKIEVIFDSQGRRVLVKHVVDLSENSILYIVDSVSEKDIAAIGEGPGTRQFSQAPASISSELDIAALHEMEDAGAEALPDNGITEITEDDFEPALAANSRNASKPDRSTFSMRSKDIETPEDGSIDTEPDPLYKTGKGRRLSRYKWLLLIVATVILAGVLLWQSGLMDFPSGPTDRSGMIAKPSEKNFTASVPPKAKRDKANASTPKVQPAAAKVQPALPAAPLSVGDAAAAYKARAASYPFSIKLDSFRTMEEVRSALAAYRAKGLDAYWVKVNLGNQGIWYRIFAGTYPSEDEAAAVIRRLGLKDAVAKTTKYATLIGMNSSQSTNDKAFKSLSDKGYAPYVIQGGDQRFFLFVGAFYTRKGAEEQQTDLLSNGIQSEIVER